MKKIPYETRLQNYEREKAELLHKELSYAEYEREIKRIAEKYNL